MIKNFKKTTGFTLVEIMVATSIFMIIMLVALGALISSSDTAKKSQALRTAMDNVNFAMESMTRSLRMGTDYYCVLSGSSVSLGELQKLGIRECGGCKRRREALNALGENPKAFEVLKALFQQEETKDGAEEDGRAEEGNQARRAGEDPGHQEGGR
jgi:Tfp pilus assembly protein PilE